MTTQLIITCDKCKTFLLDEEIQFKNDASFYQACCTSQGESTELLCPGHVLCPKCFERYTDETIRAKAVAEAEVNARFWRNEK